MFINNNVKYRDILIFALIGVAGYKVIDNLNYFISIINKIISTLSPFIYAFVCAYILNPIVRFVKNTFNLSTKLSIAVTYIIIVGMIMIGLIFTIPSIIDSLIKITYEMPNYISTTQEWINISLKNERVNELITQAGLLSNIKDITTNIGNMAMDILQGSAIYLVSLTSNIVSIVFGFLISIYVLLQKDILTKSSRTLTYMIFKEKNGKRIINFVRIYSDMIGTYVGIKSVDSAIIGFMALIILIILKVPYAPLFALIVAITNMIPYFGPLVGMILISGFTLFSSVALSFIVMLSLLALQQFDAWYLEPKLIGRKVGVSPLAIIFGVTLGGGIAGPIGMILGSPTMATIKIYYSRIFKKFKSKHPELVKNEGLE